MQAALEEITNQINNVRSKISKAQNEIDDLNNASLPEIEIKQKISEYIDSQAGSYDGFDEILRYAESPTGKLQDTTLVWTNGELSNLIPCLYTVHADLIKKNAKR